MKVVCTNCGDLVHEDDAIRLSQAQFEGIEMVKKDIPFMSVPVYDAERHWNKLSLCVHCYKKSKW